MNASRCALAGACAAALLGACGGGSSGASHPLIGNWTFSAGSSIVLSSTDNSPVPGSQRMDGVTVRVTAGATGLDLELACRCHVKLTARASAAELADPYTACLIVVGDDDVIAVPSHWEIDALDDATIRMSGDGTIPASKQILFSLGGTTLKRASVVPPPCGGKTAVGVETITPDSMPDDLGCPYGAGLDTAAIDMFGAPPDGCDSYLQGEPDALYWVDLDYVKIPSACPQRRGGSARLRLCRVDGDLFRPLHDSEGADPYAVLKLGDECPAGSQEVVRPLAREPKGSTIFLGQIAATVASGDDDEVVQLHFCVFLPDAGAQVSPADAGTSGPFPDITAPYAVFHDFDGPQPPWVIAKRSLVVEGRLDLAPPIVLDPPDGPAAAAVQRIADEATVPSSQAGGPDHHVTYLDLARIR